MHRANHLRLELHTSNKDRIGTGNRPTARFYLLILFYLGLQYFPQQGLCWTTNPDSLLEKAVLAQQERSFDQAYGLFKQAGDLFHEQQQYRNYFKCRVEMARCSQFTSVVSREAIGELMAPVIDMIANDSTLARWPEAAECYQFLARYHWAIKADYLKAIEAYNKSLEICQEIGDSARYTMMATMADLSQVYSNQEQFNQAVRYAQNALSLSEQLFGADHSENAPRYYNLGFIYYRKGHYDKALQLIQQGIQILQDKNGPELQIGLGYNNLAAVHVARMDLQGALESSEAAAQIFQKYLGPAHESIGFINLDLGTLYADLEEWKKAEEYLLEAQQIFEEQFGARYPQLPNLYHLIGHCLTKGGQITAAKQWHIKGHEASVRAFGPQHPRTGESYRQLASYYNLSGDYDKSSAAIAEGLFIARNPESNMLRSWLYSEQGLLLSAMGHYQESAQSFDLATKAICREKSQLQEPSINLTFNPLFFTEYQTEKSRALWKEYRLTGDQDMLNQAFEAVSNANEGIRRLRSTYRGGDSKLFLQKRARITYDLMLNILHELWQVTQLPKYLSMAWQISEQSKSLLLLEELKKADLALQGVPEEIRDSFFTLQQDLNFLRQSIMHKQQQGDSLGAAASRATYFAVGNELDVFKQEMQENYPDAFTLMRDLDPVSYEKVLDRMSDECVLVEYYLGDSTIHQFVLADNRCDWIKSEVSVEDLNEINQLIKYDRDLESILADPKKAIHFRDALASRIAQLLFPPEILETLEQINQLVIVPDGLLGYLSFEAFPIGNDRTYLLDNLAIAYAYSGSHYFLQSEDLRSPSLNSFAGFAPSYLPHDPTEFEADEAYAFLYRSGLIDLPGAQEEVLGIQDIVHGKAWLEEAATEEAFLRFAPDHSVLHLSLHGFVDEEDPLKSRLLFYQDAPSEGQLYAYEIYDLDLEANMVVLSACNTGAGKLERGEGILSLSRAFSHAGGANLVASLWRADDKSASQIMIEFYRNLAQGATKDQALRQAKLNFLSDQKTETYLHPYFWASHVLIGENISSFRETGNGTRYLIILLALVGIAAIFYTIRKSMN